MKRSAVAGWLSSWVIIVRWYLALIFVYYYCDFTYYMLTYHSNIIHVWILYSFSYMPIYLMSLERLHECIRYTG